MGAVRQGNQQVRRSAGNDRLKQYVFIPVNLNTATDEDILSIPGAGPRMVREFKEYRPWKTKEQFEKEIGKYVGAEGSGAAVAVCRDPVDPGRTARPAGLCTCPETLLVLAAVSATCVTSVVLPTWRGPATTWMKRLWNTPP